MPHLSASDLADLEQPRDLRISADAKYAVYVTQAWSRKESDPKTTIWLAEVGKENSSKRWTKGDHHDSSPCFSPDGTRIAFLSDRADKKGEIDLYYLSPSQPNVVKKAISVSGYGSIEAFKWNAKGDQIALNVRPEDSGADIKVHGENVRYRNLWLLDVKSGDFERLNEEDVDVTDFSWNPEGTAIVYSTQQDTEFESADYGLEIKVIDITEKRPKLRVKIDQRIQALCWSTEGILIVAGYKMRGHNHSNAVLRLDGDNLVNIAHGESDDVSGLQTARTDIPLVLVSYKMRSQIRTMDKMLYDVKGCIRWWYDSVFENDKATLVVIKDSVGTPPEVYSVIDGKECQLSRHGESIAQLNIARGHIVEYEEDGIPYNGCYAVPTNMQEAFDAKKPLPTVVAVHGGPYFRTTDEWDFIPTTAYLLSLGYLVFMVNYRGGLGHGDDYAASVLGNPEISYQDVVWLVKKGIEEGRIDKDRVAIAGWSQGGFMAYQAVANDPTFHFTAAMAGAGVSDWYVTTAASDLTYIESTYLGYSLWDKEVAAEKLKRTNPIHGASNVRSPLLIIHGEKDERVSVLNAVVFSKALKALGKDFEMAIYPREGHGVAPKVFERAHLIDVIERTARFFEKHLGKAC